MDEVNLINNKYINTDVYNIRKNPDKYLNEQAEFRSFMKNKNIDLGTINHPTTTSNVASLLDQSESIVDLTSTSRPIMNDNKLITDNINQKLNSSQDLLRTNSIRYGTDNSPGNNLLSVQIQEQQAKPTDRFVQDIKTFVSIDSKDRDTTLYPDQNSYKINLGKRVFSNVTSVKLKSSEFINTNQLIRETPVSLRNNLIFWEIEEDVDVIYDASLTSGNYNETTLATEIENRMNEVQRINGLFNNFTVTIDSVTDEVSFSALTFTTTVNPFSFSSSTVTGVTTHTDVTVNLIGHELQPGDRVVIEDANTAGGIGADFFNQEHIVTTIGTPTDDDFTIEIFGAAATSTESDVGGSSVKIGVGESFRLLWSNDNTPATILGFAEEDTDFGLIITNTAEVFKDWDSSGESTITLSDPFSWTIPGGTTTTITTDYVSHGFAIGTNITVSGFGTTGGLTDTVVNDDHQIIAVTADTFDFAVDEIATSSLSNVGGSVTIETSSTDTFRLKINKITVGPTTNVSLIRTTLPHLFSTGDRIFIYDSNNLPTASVASDQIIEYTHLYGFTPSTLTGGETGTNNVTRLNFVAAIADPAGLIITVIDSNTFTVPVPFVAITEIDDAIDDLDDFDENGDIVLKQINAAIDLTGDRYYYMTSPQLGNILTTSMVDDIFYKLQWAGGSNASIFNAFIGNGKIYYDVPLSFLDEVLFEFRDSSGELIEFNDKNHSFTLEITESIQKIEGTGFSERIGART